MVELAIGIMAPAVLAVLAWIFIHIMGRFDRIDEKFDAFAQKNNDDHTNAFERIASMEGKMENIEDTQVVITAAVYEMDKNLAYVRGSLENG